MDTIQRGYLVEMHYDIQTADGFAIGSTRDSEPLRFIPGLMETDPPALGERLLGMPVDFTGEIILEPSEAYGEALPIQQSVSVVSADSFPPDFPLEAGMIFEVDVPEHGYIPGMILEVTGDEVKIKYGHPLAGQTIHFLVEVIEARLANDNDLKTLQEKYGQS